jgi:hypothetical protein
MKHNLNNVKILIPNKKISMLVQNKLFKLGFYWFYKEHRHFIDNVHSLYLRNQKITKLGKINADMFNNHNFKEIPYQQILSIDSIIGKLYYGE